MYRFSGFCLTLLLAGSISVSANRPAPQVYISQYENVLGTSMELKVAVSSEHASELAQQAVLAEIARLSAILSAYDPQSEFSRWCKTTNTPVPVSAELFEVLRLFDAWRDQTGGA